MNSQVNLSYYVKPTPMPETFIGEVSAFNQQNGGWEIDHCFCAQVAVSLLVKPELGDKVSFIEVDGGYIILQILSRSVEQMKVVLQSKNEVCWIAPKISIQAQDELELVALNKATMTSKNLVHSAQMSLVQQAEHLILQATQLCATADDVMHLTAKQQMLIAEEDVRIDGNRINMG